VSEAAAEQTRGRRKTLVGTVVSVKMDKTAVVAVERRYPHPLYHKIIRSTKRYKAHDPNNAAVLGDTVRIVESRPISKEKRWRIMETMTRGNVAELQPREIAVPDEAGPMRQAPVAATPSTAQVADETPAVAQAPETTPTTAEVADETPMTSDSTVLAAASDDMDARDYNATPGAPDLDTDETASTAANVTPDLTVPERGEPAESAAEAASDETPMTSDSDVLAAAADDMDAKDFQPDAKDEEEDKA
jgi:small subunit ribosomal protein S17